MKNKWSLITTSLIIVPIIIFPTIACARHQHNEQGFIADYLQDIRNLLKEYLEYLKNR